MTDRATDEDERAFAYAFLGITAFFILAASSEAYGHPASFLEITHFACYFSLLFGTFLVFYHSSFCSGWVFLRDGAWNGVRGRKMELAVRVCRVCLFELYITYGLSRSLAYGASTSALK